MSRLESHQLKPFSQLLSTKLTLAPKSTGKNVSALTPHLLPLHLPVQMSGAPLPAASQGTMLHFSFPFPSHIYLPSKKILSAANSQHLLAEHTFKKKKKNAENPTRGGGEYADVLLAGLPRIENQCEKNLNKSCPEGLGRQLQLPAKYFCTSRDISEAIQKTDKL